jgi:hypothetical protein
MGNAPLCHWGLTVANLNDALKHTPPQITADDFTALSECVAAAHVKCQRSHALFMNNARFFPELRPDDCPGLVCKVSAFARNENIRVFDGKDYVDKIKLADKMHFAVESTEAIVMMYCAAIKAMRQSATQRISTSPTELTPEQDNTDSKKPRKISLAEMWEEGQTDSDIQSTEDQDPLG